jgi:putative peptidoglycan lipid II flippase
LVIGNYFGISAATEIVFFLYAPLAVLMSVALGVSDVIVMPTMHRAQLINGSKEIETAFIKVALLIIPIITVFVLSITWYFVPQASLPTILLLTPIPLLSSFSSIYIGLLNSKGRHSYAVIGPIYGAVISVLVVFLLSPTAENLAGTLLLFECGRAFGLRSHVINRNKKSMCVSEETKFLLRKALQDGKWQAFGSLLISLNPLIDIIYARSLEIGSVTSIEYTYRLSNLVPLFFTGFIITVYAKMSRAAAVSSINKVYLSKVVLKVGVSAAILSVLVIIFSKPIIEQLYSYGAITAREQLILSKLLSIYLLGATPFIIGLIYSRAFSAQRRVILLANVALVSVVFNLILNYILIKQYGIYGIALATSICHLICLILFIIFFKRSNNAIL